MEPRLGCSAVSIVSVVTLLAFMFFFFRVAPGMVESVRQFSLPRVLGLEEPEASPTPAEDALSTAITPLPEPQLTPTLEPTEAPQPSPTAFPTTGPAILDPAPTATVEPTVTPTVAPAAAEYVRVANTEGTGVYLRAEPKRDARRLRGLTDNTVLLVVGPDVQSEDLTWRNVQTTQGERLTGYILSIYLVPSGPP